MSVTKLQSIIKENEENENDDLDMAFDPMDGSEQPRDQNDINCSDDKMSQTMDLSK